MSEAKTDYEPIDQIESPNLRMLLSLPSFVDQSQILVGVKPLQRLCTIAGINHLRVQASDSGETSSFQPIVVGFDPEGGAYAAKTGLKTSVPTYSAESESSSNGPWFSRQVSGTININIDEMAKKITHERRWTHGVRSPEPWVHHLNRAFKSSINNIGLRHLLFDFNRDDLLMIAFIQTLPLVTSFGGTPEQMIRGIIIQNIIANMLWRLYTTFEGSSMRLSLIAGPQLDRAAIFKLYLATHPLIKTAPQG